MKAKKIARPLLIALAFTCLAWLGYKLLLAPKATRRDAGLNILLITLDTTRADHLGCYGYGPARTPHLDSLAREGVRFENAYCQVPLTLPSHCSLMTGMLPLYHGVRNNGTYRLDPVVDTLAEALKARGLATAAFVGSFSVDSRFGLDQGFDVYDDRFQPGQTFKSLNSERPADQVFRAFSAWLETNDSRQFFCWIHFYDPHIPYNPPSPLREEFSANPYDGEIAYTDEYTGRILEKLQEKNLLANTAVIVAGDHGEAFGEKGEYGHGLFLYDTTMKVPLIFWAPGHLPKGKAVAARVRLTDVMPTVLDLLGLEQHAGFQGTSLLPCMEGKERADRDAYIETYYPRENYGCSELTGIISGGWKYIKAPLEELYEIKGDAREERNQASSRGRTTRELRIRLMQLIKASVSSRPMAKRRLTSEEEMRLRTLGYISPVSEPAGGSPLPDPKDKIAEFQLLHQAEMREMEGNLAEAARIYGQVVDRAPDTPTHWVNLALVLIEMKRFNEATSALQKGLARSPDSEILLERLGLLLLATGKWPEALAVMERILQKNPANFNALLSSAWILDQTGAGKNALSYYDRALDIEPENRFLRLNLATLLAGMGNTASAIAIFQNLARDFPDDYEVFQNLGIACGLAGEPEKSIVALERSISLHPTPLAYFNLAVACKQVRRYADAARYLNLYLQNSAGEDPGKIRSARAELQALDQFLR